MSKRVALVLGVAAVVLAAAAPALAQGGVPTTLAMPRTFQVWSI